MTAHPQTQPLPGTVPVAQPAQPVAQETASPPKGAGRNARMALGFSLLVATAGVSFAIGHVTAEEAASTSAASFAAGAAPFAVTGIAEAAADSEVAVTVVGTEVAAADAALPAGPGSGTGTGAGGPGLAAGAGVDADTEAESGIALVEVGEMAQADPAGPPEAGAGGRPGFAGAPAGSEGIVAEITDASLTITAADGTEQTFVIDGTTSWVQQETIDASLVQLGDTVTVEIPLGPGAADSDAAVATEVVVSSAA